MDYVVLVRAGSKTAPKKINIKDSDKDDLYNRYVMKQLFIQVVGNGKMIKTLLLNVDEVAKCLKVEPSYLSAYFAYEVGTRFEYNAKKPEREKSHISGEQDARLLSRLMKKFINEIVLCPGCTYPETSLTVDNDVIFCKCSGCGYNDKLQVSNPKFAKFILQHPPTVGNTDDVINRDKMIAAHEKPEKKKAKKEENGDALDDDSVEDDDDEIIQASKAEGTKKTNSAASSNSDDWAFDTNEDAVKLRRAALVPGGAAAPKDPVTQLKDLVATKPTSAVFIKEVQKIVKQNKLSKQKFGPILFDVFFDSSNILLKDTVKNSRTYLIDFLSEEEVLQKVILNKILALCAEKKDLLSKAAAILNTFFTNDLLSDTTIVAWSKALPEDDETNKTFKQNIASMVKWLEEEDEDEEEDDE